MASFVSNDIPEYNDLNISMSDSYPTENEFYGVLANYIQFNHKNIYEPASELCGLILKRMNKTKINDNVYNIILNMVNNNNLI